MHTDHLESILAQFSTAFTTRDLMTPCDVLVRADSLEEGHAEGERRGYDVIPHPRVGPLTGYYYRGGDLTPLTPSHLVSDGTSLLDLLSLLARREFYFVLRGSEISGYVHFSDLNKPLMRTPLYLLLVATERHLLSLIRQSLAEDDVRCVLDGERFKYLQRYLRKATLKRADTSLWDVMGLRDILNVAAAYGFARVSDTEQITEREVEEMVEIRDSIAHSGLLLVDGHDAVERLIKLHQSCAQLRLLNGAPSLPSEQSLGD